MFSLAIPLKPGIAFLQAKKHEGDATACWLHACLHKLEPDESNSRYWYRRSGHSYEEYADGRVELVAIKAALTY